MWERECVSECKAILGFSISLALGIELSVKHHFTLSGQSGFANLSILRTYSKRVNSNDYMLIKEHEVIGECLNPFLIVMFNRIRNTFNGLKRCNQHPKRTYPTLGTKAFEKIRLLARLVKRDHTKKYFGSS